jgi:hypothetical protein
MGRRVGVTLVWLATALGAVACSTGGTGPGIASARGSASAGAGGAGTADPSAKGDGVKFAQCLRQHGIEAGDPSNPDGKPSIPETVDAAALDAASQACREFAPNLGKEPPAMDAAALRVWRTWAACMREQGMDVEDPLPGDVRPPMPKDRPRGQPGPDGAAAIEACNSVLPDQYKIRQEGSDDEKGQR